MKKKFKGVLILLVLVVALTVGFALLSTTLNINGIAGIRANTWDIHWENVANESGITPISGATINPNDNKEANFEVEFTIPGDYYEFEIDAVNKGTIDGMLKEIKTTLNGDSIENLPDYIGYTITYADGTTPEVNDLLAVKRQITYKVRLEYKRTITNQQLKDLPDEGEPFSMSIQVIYIQANGNANDKGNTNPTPTDFENDPWEDIINNVEEDPTSYPTGVTRPIEIDTDNDGTPETYTLRVLNNTTPASCGGSGFSESACGFVVGIEGLPYRIISKAISGTTSGTGSMGGWPASDMRAYLNSATYAYDGTDYSSTGLLNKLPKELRDNIIPTTTISSYGCISGYNSFSGTCSNPDNGGNNFSSVDKIYVPSSHELLEEDGEVEGYELYKFDKAYYSTRQLDYFAGLGVTSHHTSMLEYKMAFAFRTADIRYNYIYLQTEQNYDGWRTNGSNMPFVPYAMFRLG